MLPLASAQLEPVGSVIKQLPPVPSSTVTVPLGLVPPATTTCTVYGMPTVWFAVGVTEAMLVVVAAGLTVCALGAEALPVWAEDAA